jgi:hydroxyacylglutathione hydrolase
MSIEPSNHDLVARVEHIKSRRAKNEWTVPTTIGLEKKTNPFLRCDTSHEIRTKVGIGMEEGESTAFAKVRQAKDNFRG